MTLKVIKWTKEGYSGGYSDYSCGGLFYFNVFFGFSFTVLQIQLSCLLPQKKVYICPTDF